MKGHTTPTQPPPISDPIARAAAAPRDRPLIALISCPPPSAGVAGPTHDHRWAKQSILGHARRTVRVRYQRTNDRSPGFLHEDITYSNPTPHRTTAPIKDPWQALSQLITPDPASAPPTGDPPAAGWFGWISYDLARFLEPAAAADAAHTKVPDGFILFELHRVEAPSVYDHASNQWTTTLPPTEPSAQHPSNTPFHLLAPLAPAASASCAYQAGVRHIRQRIAAGDVYQANLTHPLHARFIGGLRSTALALIEALAPWYAAIIESGPLNDPTTSLVCSLSPELFLEYNAANRQIITRPIKGTRPLNAPPSELEHAAKDHAELTMIVDLMRNDLGRVCTPGSVRVPQLRTIETHAVHHAVATVVGTLTPNQTRTDLLRATFPPGSITGAPKIAAMRLIDELEPEPRGPYCGCIGSFPDDGSMTLNVAIRTATITPAQTTPTSDAPHYNLVYPAGAGIVADSDPHAEWLETLDKASAVAQTLASLPNPLKPTTLRTTPSTCHAPSAQPNSPR